ncbi:MAG: hypothetical protein COA49_02850 [Bacteroidetes bacterium]|nr:MAG: hypothetical protein COA49_02850 [Bacteroidota bacterium]
MIFNTLTKRYRSIFLFVGICTFVLFSSGCSTGNNRSEHPFYIASFNLDDSTSIDVLVSLSPDGLVVHNGEERVMLESRSEGLHNGFSDIYSVPVFNGAWVGHNVGSGWEGEWVDSLRTNDYQVPLTIRPLEIAATKNSFENEINTIWDTDLGKLKLKQKGDSIWGTFLTSTGDYRYQAGKINLSSGRFTLGNFDGIHLFLFEGTIRGDSIVDGVFKSGTHYSTNWGGVLSSENEVDWSSEQPWLEGSEIILRGINSNGNVVIWTPQDLIKSGHKLLVVDVMGTWCPNCMDEARLLKELSEDYPEMLVISMAFERSVGKEAVIRAAAFKKSLNLPWEVLVGGRANKSEADSALKFMGGIKSFPTTAFIPVYGAPVIHTGFSGPATGSAYEDEIAFFRSTIERFIRESR